MTDLTTGSESAVVVQKTGLFGPSKKDMMEAIDKANETIGGLQSETKASAEAFADLLAEVEKGMFDVETWDGDMPPTEEWQKDIPTYKAMLADAQVAKSLRLLQMAVNVVDHDIIIDHPEDPEEQIQKLYIEECFRTVNRAYGHNSVGIRKAINKKLRAIAYGFTVSEIVAGNRSVPCLSKALEEKSLPDRQFGMLDKLKTLDSESIKFDANPNGTLKGVKQTGMSGHPEDIPLNPGNLLIYSYEMEGMDWRGRSDFDVIYTDFYFKKFALKFRNLCLQKYGVTPLIGWTQNPDFVSTMNAILNSIRKGRALTLLGDKNTTPVEALNPNVRVDLFETSIAYHDKQIMTGLLIPTLLMEQGGAGSSGGGISLGKKHFDVWLMRLRALQLDVENLMDYLITKLIDLNWQNAPSYPKFRYKEISTPEREKLMNVFKGMIETSIADPRYDAPWMRRDLKTPDPTDEHLKALADMPLPSSEEGAGFHKPGELRQPDFNDPDADEHGDGEEPKTPDLEREHGN